MIAVSRLIEGGDYGSAGAASRALKDRLRLAGVAAEAVRRAMIASYEAEMNVVIHARRGSLWARMDDGRLDLEVVDEGPGIEDIELAMREGWSTASAEARRMGFGAGMGLPNIRRNSDRFEIVSRPGRGTRVRSTIFLTPAPVAAVRAPAVSLHGDRCRACRACLRACPTAALRVRASGPQLIEHLCIGCTSCASACPDGVFAIGARSAGSGGDSSRFADAVLVAPRGFFASFAAPPVAVLAATADLGFSEVRFTEEWERALAAEALDRARRGDGPLVAPTCPAVMALVESRFPGLLPRVAPLLSPLEAAAAEFPLHRLILVAACPSQWEAARPGSLAGRVEVLAASDLAAAVQPLLGDGRRGGRPLPPLAESPVDQPGVLRVTGIRHAVRALELAEAGALPEVLLLEPLACDGGCLGSPFLGCDPFVARHRLAAAATGQPSGDSSARGAFVTASAAVRREPRAARSGSRLDPDMVVAIEKLGQIDEAVRALPGRDCGSCGAPTCVAFAEDVVLGRAGASDCPHRTRPIGGGRR